MISLLRFLNPGQFFMFLDQSTCVDCKTIINIKISDSLIKCYVCEKKYSIYYNFHKVIKLNTIPI